MSEMPKIQHTKDYQETKAAIHSVAEEMLSGNKPLDDVERLMDAIEATQMAKDSLDQLRSEVSNNYKAQLRQAALRDLQEIGIEVQDIKEDPGNIHCRCLWKDEVFILSYNDLYQVQAISIGGMNVKMEHGAGSGIDEYTVRHVRLLLQHVHDNAASVQSAVYNGLYLEAEAMIDGKRRAVLTNGMDIFTVVNKPSGAILGEKGLSAITLRTHPPSDQHVQLVLQVSSMGIPSNPRWEYRNDEGNLTKVLAGTGEGYRVQKYENNDVTAIEHYNPSLTKESVEYPRTKEIDLFEGNEPVIHIDNQTSPFHKTIIVQGKKRVGTYREQKQLDDSLTPEKYLQDLKTILHNPERVNMFFENFMTYAKEPKLSFDDVQTAEETLRRDMRGDCDDYAELGVTLLRANGYMAHAISVEAIEGPHATCLYWKKLPSGQWEVGRICTYPPQSTIAASLEDGTRKVLAASNFAWDPSHRGLIFVHFPTSVRAGRYQVALSTLQDHPEYAMDYSEAMAKEGRENKFNALRALRNTYPEDVQISFDLAYQSRMLQREDASEYFRALLERGESPGGVVMMDLMRRFLADTHMDPIESEKFFRGITPALLKRNLPLLNKPHLSEDRKREIVSGMRFVMEHAKYSDVEIEKMLDPSLNDH